LNVAAAFHAAAFPKSWYRHSMRVALTLLFGLVCLVVGLLVGIFFSAQLKLTEPVQRIESMVGKVPLTKSLVTQADKDSPFEDYQYPRIKWRAKPLPDAPEGIGQLSTTWDGNGTNGSMKYRLTVFKGSGKDRYEVQILDGSGFKIKQFNASDFHAVPGAPDIMESRESVPCTEDDYRKARDYSIK
jgi:hypothetical protein